MCRPMRAFPHWALEERRMNMAAKLVIICALLIDTFQSIMSTLMMESSSKVPKSMKRIWAAGYPMKASGPVKKLHMAAKSGEEDSHESYPNDLVPSQYFPLANSDVSDELPRVSPYLI